MKKLRNITVLVILISLVLGFAGCSSQAENNLGSNPEITFKKVAVKKIVPETITRHLRLTGIIKPGMQTTVASEGNGRVVRIDTEVGDYVFAGQGLVHLEQNSGSIARASYETALRSLQNAINAYENTKLSLEKDLENAELSIENAQILSDKAKTSQENLEKQLVQDESNLYRNTQIDIESSLVSADNYLNIANNVLGEDSGNKQVNDNFEHLLGVLSSQSEINAKRSYQVAKNSYSQLSDSFSQGKNNLSYQETEHFLRENKKMLEKTKVSLDDVSFLLDNTTSDSGFSDIALNTLKLQVNTTQGGLTREISIIQNTINKIDNFEINRQTQADNAKAITESAEKSLASIQKQKEGLKEKVQVREIGAKTQVDLSKGQLDIARIQLEKTNITAPLSGIVLEKMVELGTLVGIGTPVAIVANTETVKVKTDIIEKDLGKVFLGQKAFIKVDAYPEEIFEGLVSKIAPAADSLSKKFPLEISIDNHDQRLKPSMFARVSLEIEKKENTLKVPFEALVRSDDGETNIPMVFVVRDNQAFLMEVGVGLINETEIEVLQGLNEGDLIVVEGVLGLKNEDKVEATNPQESWEDLEMFRELNQRATSNL